METGQQMRETNHKQRRATHSDGTPHRRDKDPERIEDTGNNRHHDNVIPECPEQIDPDEKITPSKQTDKSQDLMQVL